MTLEGPREGPPAHPEDREAMARGDEPGNAKHEWVGDENARLGGRAVAVLGAVAIVVVAFVSLAPLWAPLALAAWTAALMRPITDRVARLAGGRKSVGAAVGVVLVHSLLVPVVVLTAVVVRDAMAFGRQLAASGALRDVLTAFVSEGRAGTGAEAGARAVAALHLPNLNPTLVSRAVKFATEHGTTAWNMAVQVAGAGASAVLAVIIFAVTLYAALADGDRAWRWAEEHAPISRQSARRLARAFHETGRGLVVGAGMTSLVQAGLSVAIFVALGVPRALVLGAATFVAAFIPALGTGLVWGPVAVGLAMAGHPGKAAILVVLGLVGIGSIDNLIRPVFQRWGELDLPASLLLFAAFGGLTAFGAKGLLLGPLAVRMAREVLEIARDARATGDAAQRKSTPPGAVP